MILVLSLLLGCQLFQTAWAEAADRSYRYREPIVFGRTEIDPATGQKLVASKLWIMEADGSHLRQLTSGTTYDDHPSLYADLQHVLYAEFPTNGLVREAGARLIRLNIYSGKREVVHEVAGCALHHATISPLDDELVVYHQDCGERQSLWFGLGRDRFELSTVAINGVAASPDSVIFMHEKNRGVAPREVALARLWGSGKGARMIFLTDDKALHRRPAVSPDGKQMAWQSNAEGGEDEILLAELDGSNVRNLTNAGGSDGHPWFSRDGRWIVFESDRTAPSASRINQCDRFTHCEIWKLNLETGETVRLTSGEGRYVSTRPRM